MDRLIDKLQKSAINNRRDIRPGMRKYGLYLYLIDVYRVYLNLRSKRIAKKTAHLIAKRFNLRTHYNSHPLLVLITASVGEEDAKQKSRWAQALKNAAGWRQPPEKLIWFFSASGGIYGASRKEAEKRRWRANRRSRANL